MRAISYAILRRGDEVLLQLRWFRLDALPPNVVAHELLVLGRLGSGLPPILCMG